MSDKVVRRFRDALPPDVRLWIEPGAESSYTVGGFQGYHIQISYLRSNDGSSCSSLPRTIGTFEGKLYFGGQRLLQTSRVIDENTMTNLHELWQDRYEDIIEQMESVFNDDVGTRLFENDKYLKEEYSKSKGVYLY